MKKAKTYQMNHKIRRTKISMIILAGISFFGMQNAIAQVSSIPDGGNLNAYTPSNGDIWNLQGDAYLSNGSTSQASTALPANLAINGVTGGSTITLNDGAGHYNYFSGTAATVLNLSNVTITGGSATAFGGSLQGGAINAAAGLTINSSGIVAFTGNQARTSGGAIYVAAGGMVVNGGLDLINNTSNSNGGAVYIDSGGFTVTGAVNFEGNNTFYSTSSLNLGGGAVYSYGDVALATAGGDVKLVNNRANAYGGAIYAGYSNVFIGNGTGNVTITGNQAGINVGGQVIFDTGGGAINANGAQGITISGTTITIADNGASSSGGALYSTNSTTLNGNVIANNNFANNIYGTGGAGFIYAGKDVTVNGTLSASGNQTQAAGGAIYAANNVNVTANGATNFTGNSAAGKGGAIWAGNDVTLNAIGGDISFKGNSHSEPLANAIWLDNSVGTATAALNADTGRTITFFDPIQNNAVNGQISVVKNGDGILSFDGSQYSAEAERWSQIYGNTDVQGGIFEVANHAIYGVQATDVSQTVNTTFNMRDNTVLQGGVMGTVRADEVAFGDNITVNIAGRQSGVRSVFEIASPSLTLGNDNRILFNTYLNDGVVQNTDLLHLNGTVVTGDAKLYVINTGGPGAYTPGNGIMLVKVDNGGSTNSNTFKLGQRVISGVNEYDLYQGGVGTDAGDGNWYLRNLTQPDPAPGPGIDLQPGPTKPTRPEPGVYLRNMTAASGMFMHTLHDRLGEPQFTDAYKDSTDGKVSSLWVRIVGNHSDGKAGNGAIDMKTDNSLIHLGGDLARWSTDGKDRWQVGLMGAYGRSDTDANMTDRRYTDSGLRQVASGNVDGYGAGGYLTWFGNKDKPTGPYVDLWGMYGWYKNKVQGNTLAQEKYDSTNWIVSAETGYALVAHDGDKRQWLIEPQAQVAYNQYSEDNHREANGTWVTDGDSDGVVTRLGARVYSRSKLGDNGIQPFVEANWWHGTAQNTLRFNGALVDDGTPKDTYELKVGAQGEIAKNWQLWGHVGGRVGSNSYSSYEGMVGAKYQF